MLSKLKPKSVSKPLTRSVRADQINPKRSDPVYGDALAKTWDWLSSIANEEVVDFSIEAMDRALEETESFELFAPSDKAPILMPAHIDCLAQTNPRPVPEPDVSLFLRGPERPFAEVRVLWRDDLEGRENWYDEILSVVPPAVSETLGVPLTYFCSWLSEGDEQAEGLADVAGIQESKTHGNGINTSIKRGPVYRWRGADDESTGLITDIRELKPNDVLILQVEKIDSDKKQSSELLGDFYPADSSEIVWDRGDEAQYRSRLQSVLRIDVGPRGTDGERIDKRPLTSLESFFYDDSGQVRMPEVVFDDLEGLKDAIETELRVERVQWRRTVLEHLLMNSSELDIQLHGDGLVRPFLWSLQTSKRLSAKGADRDITQDGDEPSDEFSVTSREQVFLLEHCDAVGKTAASFGKLIGLDQCVVEDLRLAGELHDLGKSDPRFQAWLSNGSMKLSDPNKLLAKSGGQSSRSARERARRESGYPKGKRHEFVSAGIAAAHPELLAHAHDPELVLYLIAVHHGFGRSICLDNQETEEHATLQTWIYKVRDIELSGSVDQRYGSPDSGHSERFWNLIKRYGPWTLAFLESLLVSADQLCSKDPMACHSSDKESAIEVAQPRKVDSFKTDYELVLDGPDGSNVLGFLCALGVVRTLDKMQIPARLFWRKDAKWTPVLKLPEPMSTSDFSEYLATHLRTTEWVEPMNTVENTTKFGIDNVSRWNKSAQSEWLNGSDYGRLWCEWLVALVGEVESKEGVALDTAFRTMGGAGHQHFLRTMRDLQELTEKSHIESSLFDFWAYEDGRPTLRFDPFDDRRHALRWNDPSSTKREPIRSVRGANRLALEALPLFPTWPSQKRLETAAFEAPDIRATYFYWPLWTKPLSLDAMRGFLWNREWQTKDPSLLEALSIEELYRSQRITINKVRNFTPSQALSVQPPQLKDNTRSFRHLLKA